MKSWECHKCGYVWSSMIPGCENCNKPKASEGENQLLSSGNLNWNNKGGFQERPWWKDANADPLKNTTLCNIKVVEEF